ncbi:MAG: hypothetical protein M1607_04065, partial [Patescibacteria group bacterium]|nr:hypothetical protein [Patescibacteria group bacterium]
YDQTEVAISAKQMDPRAIILQSYLAQYNSPLQYHAQDFVEAADANNIDWKLVAAISGVESTFGKQIPGGYEQSSTSYNAWGWGVYGTQALYFKSWKDGIYTVSAGLRNNYFNKGYTDPYSINKIYAASPTWGYRVSYFLADMNQYQAQYATASTLGKYSLISFPTTDSSAILALEKNFN